MKGIACKETVSLVFLMVFLGMISPALTQAQKPAFKGGIKVGPLRVHPGVDISETYTDNFFLDPDDEESDWTTLFSPNLVVDLPLRRHGFRFEYRSDFYRNLRHTDNNVDHHMVGGTLFLDFPGGLTIEAGHKWVASSNPPVIEGDEEKEFKDNISRIDVGYAFTDRYSISVQYTHTIRRFDEDIYEVDDYDEDGVSLSLYYRILPKTRVFIEGGWTRIEFPERDVYDSNNWWVWVGARTTPAAKIVGEIKGGWSMKVWDDDVVGDDVITFGMEGNLYFDPTPRTRLTLTLYRRIQDATFTTTENVVYGSSYTSTGGKFGVRQGFGPRLEGFGSFGLEYLQFNEKGLASEKRRDRLIEAAVGLRYRIWKWIFFGMGYEFRNKESTIEVEDYTENRFMASISIAP
jgi:hypothetical protein